MKRILLMLIGITILGMFIYWVGVDEIKIAVANLEVKYLLLALILQFMSIFFWHLRWKLSIKAIDREIKDRNLFSILLCGIFVNNITPSAKMGGEPMRAYLLKKSAGIPMEEGLATVAIERILEIISLVIVCLFSLVMLLIGWNLPKNVFFYVLITISIILFSLILFFYFCLAEGMEIHLTDFFASFLGKISNFPFVGKYLKSIPEHKILEAITAFQKSIQILMKKTEFLIVGLFLGFMAIFLDVLRVVVVFYALSSLFVTLSLSMPPIQVIVLVMLLTYLVSTLPLLPGGVGVTEPVMFTLYILVGIPHFISAAISVIDRTISYWFVTAISGLFSLIVGFTEF
ncbi:MAG: flippase-like domain-containing protein [Candidatus Hydrothermarchaeota archaeon]